MSHTVLLTLEQKMRCNLVAWDPLCTRLHRGLNRVRGFIELEVTHYETLRH